MSKSTTRIRDWVLAGNPLEQACVAYGDFWQATQEGGAKITGLVAWLEQKYELKYATAAQVSRLLRAADLIPKPSYPSGETTLTVTDTTRTTITPEQLCELLGLEMPETVDVQ